MNDERPDLVRGFGFIVGASSIAAILILWMALITLGIGRLFGQNWTMANVAFAHLLALGSLGLVGFFRFRR